MTLEVGVRVVRGPDWQWGEQDGGEGNVGTVIQVPGSKSAKSWKYRTLFVRWDGGKETEVNGVTGNYRIYGQHDLRMLDSSSAGVQFVGVRCRECNSSDIRGTRWQCCVCNEYNLCTHCYMDDKHNLSHNFMRFDLPRDTGVRVPIREYSKKLEYCGMYAGAKVLRDVSDWLKSGQDGGMGTFGVVIGDAEEPGMIRVKWEDRLLFDHHLGKNGKVDLWTLSPSYGGSYYPEHLTLLDSAHFCERILERRKDRIDTTAEIQSCVHPEKGQNRIESMADIELQVEQIRCGTSKDNVVRKDSLAKAWLAETDLNEANQEYEDFGKDEDSSDNEDKYDDSDSEEYDSDFSDENEDDNTDSDSAESIVNEDSDADSDGGGVFDSGQHERLMRALQLGGGAAGGAEFMEVMRRIMEGSGAARMQQLRTEERGMIAQGEVCRGEMVLIDPDLDATALERLQGEPGAGGWSREMRKFIGKIGIIKDVVPGRAVVVGFDDMQRRWHFNSKAVAAKIYTVGDEVYVSEDETGVRKRQKHHGGWVPDMKKMLGNIYNVVSVEEDGSRLMLRYKEGLDLELNPWSCALETPAAEHQGGHTMEEVEKMLAGGVDPCAPVDDNGNTILHSVVLKSDNPSVLERLLERYPQACDSVNFQLQTLLHCAVLKRRTNCVRLLFQRGLNLNLKDIDGRTPLHSAIHNSRSTAPRDAIIEILTQPSRFDYSIGDEGKVNVLQLAALRDHAYAAKRIIGVAPTLLDNSRETAVQGFTGISSPLYLACGSGNLRFVKTVIEYNRSYLEKKPISSDQTPLAFTICHRESAVAEYLVLAGANPNAARMNGDTCMHMVLGYLLDPTEPKQPMCNGEYTTEISQIYSRLPLDMQYRSWIALLCFLIKHGANFGLSNRTGVTPGQMAEKYARGLPELLRYYAPR